MVKEEEDYGQESNPVKIIPGCSNKVAESSPVPYFRVTEATPGPSFSPLDSTLLPALTLVLKYSVGFSPTPSKRSAHALGASTLPRGSFLRNTSLHKLQSSLCLLLHCRNIIN